MSFKQQSDISKEWSLCMCSIAQCNVTCDQQTIQDIIDSALFNPGNSQGFLNNDGNGVLSWIPLESTIDYFFTNTASDIATYKQLLTSTVSVQSTITTASVTDTQVLQNWATNANVPNTLTIPSGLYVVNIHAAQTVVGGKSVQLYADIVECNSTGTDIAIIGTTGYSTVLTGLQSDLFVTFNLSSAYVMASLTSRIVVRVRAHVTGVGSAPTVVLYYGGTTDSHVTIPSTTSFGGITSPANGGTGQDTSGSTGVAQVNSGTWSVSTALANGTTATTQAANDNSTKIATTAYVDTADSLNLKIANNLSDLNNANTARNNLGLYTIWMPNGDQSTTNNTATSITDLVFSVAANTKYSFMGTFKVTGTTSSGVKFAVTIPTLATMFFTVQGATTSSGTFGSANMSTSGTLTTTAFVNQTATLGISIAGTVFVGANSGSVQFQFASGTNGSNSTISQLGTFIKISPIV